MCFGVLAELATAAVGAPAAEDDAEEEEAAETGCEADDEGEVAVDPGCDFFSDGTTLTLAIVATSTACAGCAVEEVLLETVADTSTKLGTRTTDHAVAVITGIRIVALSVAAHNGLALLITRSTLSTCTL